MKVIVGSGSESQRLMRKRVVVFLILLAVIAPLCAEPGDDLAEDGGLITPVPSSRENDGVGLFGLEGFPSGTHLPDDEMIGRLVDPNTESDDQSIIALVGEFFLSDGASGDRINSVNPEMRTFFLAMYHGLIRQLPVDRIRIGEVSRFDDMARVSVRVETGRDLVVYEVFCSDSTGVWKIESIE